jgi:hypothetical protein
MLKRKQSFSPTPEGALSNTESHRLSNLLVFCTWWQASYQLALGQLNAEGRGNELQEKLPSWQGHRCSTATMSLLHRGWCDHVRGPEGQADGMIARQSERPPWSDDRGCGKGRSDPSSWEFTVSGLQLKQTKFISPQRWKALPPALPCSNTHSHPISKTPWTGYLWGWETHRQASDGAHFGLSIPRSIPLRSHRKDLY